MIIISTHIDILQEGLVNAGEPPGFRPRLGWERCGRPHLGPAESKPNTFRARRRMFSASFGFAGALGRESRGLSRSRGAVAVAAHPVNLHAMPLGCETACDGNPGQPFLEAGCRGTFGDQAAHTAHQVMVST